MLGSFADTLSGQKKIIATNILMVGRATLHNFFSSKTKILRDNQNFLLGLINSSMSALKYIPGMASLRYYKCTPIYNLDGSPFISLNSRFIDNEKNTTSSNYIKNQIFAPFNFKSHFNMFLMNE